MKTAEQHEARALRAQGLSINEIRYRLGVSKSSVSSWVRDVELGPEARERLVRRVRMGPIVAAERKAAEARVVRLEYQLQGRRRARIEDASYAAGCMLYWAEGEKSRGRLAISNSDVEVLRLFAAFLRVHFEVPDQKMRLHCYLFADHLDRQLQIEEFWLAAVGLERDRSLMKSSVNVYSRSSQRKRVNKLPFGTCTLIVNSTQILQTIYGSIQEYGGFDRPEWLD